MLGDPPTCLLVAEYEKIMSPDGFCSKTSKTRQRQANWAKLVKSKPIREKSGIFKSKQVQNDTRNRTDTYKSKQVQNDIIRIKTKFFKTYSQVYAQTLRLIIVYLKPKYRCLEIVRCPEVIR